MEQTTRKTNNKKLVVALALLALIVVASVITTVVLVLAANQQTVQSNVNVTYSVTDVSAKVYGKYTVRNASAVAMDPDSITINPTDTTTTPMSPKDLIGLTSTNNYVVFEYKFENSTYVAGEGDDAAAGTYNGTTENVFSIALTYADDNSPADKNVTVKYTSSNAPLTAFEDANVTDWDSSFASVDCAAVTYVYVRVSVTDVNAAATFSGSFNFVLTSKASA